MRGRANIYYLFKYDLDTMISAAAPCRCGWLLCCVSVGKVRGGTAAGQLLDGEEEHV